MGLKQFNDIYRNKRVLITGNSGFKGSWLALWLQDLGAQVFGFSAPNFSNDFHFKALNLPYETHFGNVEDLSRTQEVVSKVKPDIIFHMAAQSLVNQSYQDPFTNFSTNIMGVASILEALRVSPAKGAIIITTDKVYENSNAGIPFAEGDRLGGRDPYSASKACAEIVANSFRESFNLNVKGRPLVATARAGNVIGGGDYSQDRLIPDIIRAIRDLRPLLVRNPDSTRPWQHVLEPLAGYLQLGEKILLGEAHFSSAYNFGPSLNDCLTVGEMLKLAQDQFPQLRIEQVGGSFYEAHRLELNVQRANDELGYRPVWNASEALSKTLKWYGSEVPSQQSKEDLMSYTCAAKEMGCGWIS